ncbi:DUF551 domain-containing protein [Enterobacter roggenkampii]|uniref:DUF551 domain-containing protein n=1 Tax=Enterobacter roggenkampii TaxID=1812935 RepID=UPI002FF7ED71
MSTITREFTKEQLQQIIETDHVQCGETSSLARIALASLEAEPVAWAHRLINKRNGVVHPWVYGSAEACPSEGDIFNIEVMPLYTVPPAPVSVPAAMEMDDDFDSAFEHGKAVGWNAYRAAMLQGADRPQNEPQNIPENIPATQFKPIADLYGLTSPTGGETSFTFDAVEARDFIDGGWLCQEYVELGRFQEAMLQNGNSPAQSDCCPEQNYIAPAQDGDSPVIPDGWKLVPIDPTKDMLRAGQSVVGFWLNTVHCYSKMLAAAPAAPQQEVMP